MYNSTFRMIQFRRHQLFRMLNYGVMCLSHLHHRNLCDLMCLSLQVLVNSNLLRHHRHQQCCYMLSFHSLHNSFLRRR